MLSTREARFAASPTTLEMRHDHHNTATKANSEKLILIANESDHIGPFHLQKHLDHIAEIAEVN